MFRNGFQTWHLIVVLVVILLLFGANRLPTLAKSIGESLKIFKKEIKDITSDDEPTGTNTGTNTGTTTSTTDATPADLKPYTDK